MKAFFDVEHGQQNWKTTGFFARTITGSFSGLTDILSELRIESWSGSDLHNSLDDSKIIVIPPPAGTFNRAESQWEPLPAHFFTESDVERILEFVHAGGRLLAFSYRFGDSFAKSNLKELFLPMGCLIQDTAAINLDSFVNEMHPLAVPFETDSEHLPLLDENQSLPDSVHWRSMATLSILPNSNSFPIAVTPPRCITFEPQSFRILHKPQMIAVGGHYGDGRFALFGGPHVFETTGYGLLREGSNHLFAKQVLEWLISHSPSPKQISFANETVTAFESDLKPMQTLWKGVQNAQSAQAKGDLMVQFISQICHRTGIMAPVGEKIWSLKRTSELDLVYRTSSQEPIWAHSKGIIPVECKNWDHPVGSSHIAWFAEKVAKTGSEIGFFASRSFTHKAWMTVEQMLLRHGVTIGLLHDDDYQSFLKGDVSARDMVESSLLRSMLL